MTALEGGHSGETPHRFDVVILGGGSAGCVLAARLSTDPGTTVLLVEAGPDLPLDRMPAAISSPYPGRAYFNPGWTWPGLQAAMGRPHSNIETATTRPYEQARLVGGGSAINGIGANRGAPGDYDEWAALGAKGWGWDDVLPYFKKLERDLDFGQDTRLHNDDGPLPIQRVPRRLHTAFAKDVEAEFQARGYASRDDQNGDWQDGSYPITVNLDESGRRASTATAYLTHAVRRRSNLAIWPDTVAERVVIAGGRATGAQLRGPGGAAKVTASLVIVCAGALHSPAILMRSGVGSGAALSRLGIGVVAARPGVGRNLQEHPSIGVSAFLPKAARLVKGDHYHIQSVVRWSSGLAEGAAGDMHMAVNTRSGWHAVGHRLGTLFSWVNKSHSVGSVELASSDPAISPLVDFCLLSDRRDLLRLAEAFRLAGAVLHALQQQGRCLEVFPTTYSANVRKWLRPSRRNGMLMALAGPMMDQSKLIRNAVIKVAQEGSPGMAALYADEALLHAHLNRHVGGVWHPCGTCRIGAEDDLQAVCDSEGRVLGVEGLRVCDASLMPTIPRANLNIPVLMMAEKIAAGIRPCAGSGDTRFR